MHKKALLRQAELEARVAELEGKLRLREQQLFGRKTEVGAGPSEALSTPRPKKPRGQQPSKPGPTRRDYSHLPATEVVLELRPEQQLCSCCGKPFDPFPGTEDSEVLEIDVKAYRRLFRRKRYRPTCSCEVNPGILAALSAPKVIPKTILGVSIWVEILLDKFLYYRPTYRLLRQWQTLRLDLSLGTVTGGLQKLLPLFQPVYQALIEHNQQQKHWPADETRWLVFVTLEGKVGYRWFLWVFHSQAPAASWYPIQNLNVAKSLVCPPTCPARTVYSKSGPTWSSIHFLARSKLCQSLPNSASFLSVSSPTRIRIVTTMKRE